MRWRQLNLIGTALPWNNGILEYWNNERSHIAMSLVFKPIIPIFHHAIIPVWKSLFLWFYTQCHNKLRILYPIVGLTCSNETKISQTLSMVAQGFMSFCIVSSREASVQQTWPSQNGDNQRGKTCQYMSMNMFNGRVNWEKCLNLNKL
jgi:hypothetical protein